MVAAYDTKTGLIATGRSNNASALGDKTKGFVEGKLGGKIGEKTNLCNNKIGYCAEVDAANKLVAKGVPIERIKFTEALRPRHAWRNKEYMKDSIVETCKNCKATWAEENFK
ncbi:hypothetical protein [Snodgrassella communis]|uniref:hypothetical protein n=1 Tax=Snodgrassella communis TaxID=2946699 RepID=UPI00286B3581|nr:hypothetical protein [Snodgrassella communis]WMY91676.1 hypothetical protein PYG29_09630 [Snodgrassella communis]